MIPIIVRPADWEWASCGKLQALPKDAKPITSWSSQASSWLDVVKGVRKAARELLVERREPVAAEERYRDAVEVARTDKTFRAVRIERGARGWGGPLVIQPTAEKDKIVAVTGRGIPEVARRIAELTGAEAVDGFRAPPPESGIAAVVVDCGGTARAGVYPRKRIPTVNLTPVGQVGPLAQFIKEDIYVSGVRPQNVNLADGPAMRM